MADVTSLLKTGASSARIDITFVAEGYLASERDKFIADSAKYLDYMFNARNSALNAPFSNYKGYFNANALFVASNESRWDIASGMADTYFKANTYLEDGRLVYGDHVRVRETVAAALPRDAQDITIVLVNSKAYGGSGGAAPWATTGNLASAEILLHELGHSIAGMGDEYVDAALGSTPLTQPLNLPNVTTVKDAPPWKAWLGYEDALGKVGVYEGGYYRATGVWRATEDSKMLTLGKSFNAPEKEALALGFYGRIGDYLALDTRIPGLCFAEVPDRGSLAYRWTEGGAELAYGSGFCLDVYGIGKYGAGTTITLTTTDATGLIRTGLELTRQSESLAVQGEVLQMAGTAVDITEGGKVLRFGGMDNTLTVGERVSAAYIDGGNGADTVVLAMNQAGASLEQLASGTWLLSHASGAALALRNVEFIRFSDATRALVEIVTGSSGNDQLQNRSGSELIDGGAGLDVLGYAGARAGFVVERSGSGFTVTDAASGRADVLANVERLRFDDAAVALDIDGVAGQAYRLYQAAFDRTPDGAGLGYWIGMMDQGQGLREVAAGFAASAEFEAVYGAGSTGAQIVARLYQNVLHRPGEAAGVAYWLDILESGKDTVAGVLAAFSESAENQQALAGLIGNGFAYVPYA